MARRGEEARAEKNLKDDDQEHGGGPRTARERFRRDVFIDKHHDEDGDPDTQDDMRPMRKRLEKIRKEEKEAKQGPSRLSRMVERVRKKARNADKDAK